MTAKPGQLSRRELIKPYGLSALLLHPVLRSMAYAAETPFARAPRYVMFFKGGAFYPARTKPGVARRSCRHADRAARSRTPRTSSCSRA